jgi:predicted aldo/keto reductase-like oxidoreductase
MGSVAMVEENAALFHERQLLNDKEQQTLEKARVAFMDALGVPCSGCRYCCDECPEGLDIPLLIRYFNEKNLGGEAWKIPGLDKAKPADDCIQCGACMAHCPQKIKIPEIMASLQKKE